MHKKTTLKVSIIFLIICVYAPALSIKLYSQVQTPDISGKWEGEQTNGKLIMYYEICLAKTGDNEYSGFDYCRWIRNADNEPILFKGELPHAKKTFTGNFDGSVLAINEIANIENTKWRLLNEHFRLIDNNGIAELVNNDPGQPNRTFHLRRTGGFPKEYEQYIVRNSTTTTTNSVASKSTAVSKNESLSIKPGKTNSLPANTNIAEDHGNEIDDQRFVGYWKIISCQFDGQAITNLPNDHYEMYRKGMLILRKEFNNSVENVQTLQWYTKNDILDILGHDYTFNFSHDTLTLKSIVSNEDLRKSTSEKNLQKLILKRISANPFETYRTLLPSADAAGTWTVLAPQDGIEFKLSNLFYDIHPISDKEGEIISYAYNDRKKIPYDSIEIYKYSLKSNNANSKEHIYLFSGTHYNTQENISFLVSDGIMLMKDVSGGKGTAVFAKVSSKNAFSLSKMKQDLMKYYNDNSTSPPEGTTWMTCIACGGTGVIETSELVVSGYTREGYERYTEQRKTSTCPDCDGKGGYYVDKNGNQR